MTVTVSQNLNAIQKISTMCNQQLIVGTCFQVLNV